MKALRIIFMGTPDFAVASLKALVKESYQIVAVITAPDKPAGRGRKLHESAVKKYALSEGIPILQPENLKNTAFLEELKSYKADLQVVVAFRMLPKQVWSMPSLGTFNLHASLLPDYRGAAPINWAIINGEQRTGVTTFYINEDIDTGAILLQQSVSIGSDTSAGQLHDTLMEIGGRLVVETVRLIEKGQAHPKQQAEGNYHSAPKLNKENCRIRWDEPLESIHNHIRGLSPYPGAWTVLRNKDTTIELKIYGGTGAIEVHEFAPGTVIASKKSLKVATQNGFYRIKDIKMAGKKRMDAKSLLNGYEFYDDCKMF